MPSEVERKKYCHGCGTEVPYYTMISPEGEVDKCQFCSSVLQEEAVPAEAVSLGTVYVVEDTALLREMIKDILLGKNMAERVTGCANGAELVARYTRDLLLKNAPELIMLDVVMPLMNGINAAVAVRAVERAFDVSSAPIVFFTVKQCDDSFRKVLKYCSPAMYINKGRDSSPDKLRERVGMVVAQVLKEIEEGD